MKIYIRRVKNNIAWNVDFLRVRRAKRKTTAWNESTPTINGSFQFTFWEGEK